MNWDIEWDAGAVEALKRLPSWQAAAHVCRAVRDFAEHGVGDVRQVHGQEFRMHVGSFAVRFGVDAESRTLHVWTVFRKG